MPGAQIWLADLKASRNVLNNQGLGQPFGGTSCALPTRGDVPNKVSGRLPVTRAPHRVDWLVIDGPGQLVKY